jgi:sulfur carrier protein ThiS
VNYISPCPTSSKVGAAVDNSIRSEENDFVVTQLSDTISKPRIRKLIVTEPKTVAELLLELELADDHVVLIAGKRVAMDHLIQENDSVVVLPRIAGG